jgi:hypothetical protein
VSNATPSPKRKPIPKRLRFEVLTRDHHACRYCGQMAPDVKLTIDHVVPVVLGGKDEPGNLVTACVDCNAGKASTSPDERIVDDVAADALRWAGAMQRAAEIAAAEDAPRREYVAAFRKKWDTWGTGWDKRDPIPLPPNWAASVEGFHRAFLPVDDMTEAVDIAGRNSKVHPSDMFRYFCGVCWKRIERLQTIATDLIAKEGA